MTMDMTWKTIKTINADADQRNALVILLGKTS